MKKENALPAVSPVLSPEYTDHEEVSTTRTTAVPKYTDIPLEVLSAKNNQQTVVVFRNVVVREASPYWKTPTPTPTKIIITPTPTQTNNVTGVAKEIVFVAADITVITIKLSFELVKLILEILHEILKIFTGRPTPTRMVKGQGENGHGNTVNVYNYGNNTTVNVKQ